VDEKEERGSTRSDPSPRDEYYDEAFSAYMHFVLGFLFTIRGPVDQFSENRRVVVGFRRVS
jgi:hypothetical protein